MIRHISSPIGAIFGLLKEITDGLDNSPIIGQDISDKFDIIDSIIKMLFNPNKTGILPEEHEESRLSGNRDILEIQDTIYNSGIFNNIDKLDKKIRGSSIENKEFFIRRLTAIKTRIDIIEKFQDE